MKSTNGGLGILRRLRLSSVTLPLERSERGVLTQRTFTRLMGVDRGTPTVDMIWTDAVRPHYLAGKDDADEKGRHT
jgi:hypothetical protein